MIVGSVCSGVGTCALASPPGWEHAWFSEIAPFPSAILAHRFPDVPNVGDMTEIKADAGPVDILVGGTPCQSFSVAGLRAGLADPRGNLMLVFLRLAKTLQARWLVWENVPGVLSSNEGRDFGAFLGALGQLGYGWSYRVLDAKNFGVPQRRRRVFVVAHLGDSAGPASVLFEPEGVRGDSSACGEKGEDSSGFAGEGAERDGGQVFRMRAFGDYSDDGKCGAVKARDFKDATDLVCVTGAQTHAMDTAHGATEDGTGRGTPIIADTITSCFHKHHGASGGKDSLPRNHIVNGSGVRRLTAKECERLQGLPDDWTQIPYRSKPADKCPDGPRYKAIGNGWALPVAAWVFARLDRIDAMPKGGRS